MRDGVPTRKSSRLGNAAQVSALEDGHSTARAPPKVKAPSNYLTWTQPHHLSHTHRVNTCICIYLPTFVYISVAPFKRHIKNFFNVAKNGMCTGFLKIDNFWKELLKQIDLKMFKSSVYGEVTHNYTSFNRQYYNPQVCSFLLRTYSDCTTFVTGLY